MYQHHPTDLAESAALQLLPSAEPKPMMTQESMYLIVRSLKHNNEKVVSLNKPD